VTAHTLTALLLVAALGEARPRRCVARDSRLADAALALEQLEPVRGDAPSTASASVCESLASATPAGTTDTDMPMCCSPALTAWRFSAEEGTSRRLSASYPWGPPRRTTGGERFVGWACRRGDKLASSRGQTAGWSGSAAAWSSPQATARALPCRLARRLASSVDSYGVPRTRGLLVLSTGQAKRPSTGRCPLFPTPRATNSSSSSCFVFSRSCLGARIACCCASARCR